MALLDIRVGEGRRVALLLFHSFCNGVSLAVLIAAAPSLFLDHFEASALPYCYIASAVVVPAIGFGYMRVAGKLPLGGLLVANLLFLLGGLLVLRIMFLGGMERVPAALMITWVDVQVVLLGLEFDALSGCLFDLRQAKRIFPIIGTGEVVAGMLGGLVVPVIAPRLGAENLLWVSAAGVGCALAMVEVLRPRGAAGAAVAEATPGQGRQRGGRLGSLGVALVVTVALADLASYFGDNIFYTQVSARFANPEAMAGFIGVYLACAGGLALVVRLLITPWLFQRFGVTAGLVVGPALACVLALVLSLAMGGVLAPALIVFWSAAGLKLNDDVHRKSNHRTGLFLMLQALPVGTRIRTQAIMEGYAGSLIGGLAGGLLLGLNRWSPMAAPMALVGIALAWLVWVLRVRRPYLEAVAGSLRRQLLLTDQTQLLDASSRELLRGYLQGNDPALILYAMHCLEQSEIGPADLQKLLGHALPEIRLEAVRVAARRAAPEDLPAIEALIGRETDPRVLAELIQAALAISPSSGIGIARRHLRARDLVVRRFAVSGLLRQEAEGAEALEALRQLASSADPAERLAAVRVLEESGSASVAPLLFERLADGAPAVRRAAARAAGRFPQGAVSRRLVALLEDPDCRQEATQALRRHGEGVMDTIRERWGAGPVDRLGRQGLVRAAGHLPGVRGREWLWELTHNPDRHLRGEVLAALAIHPAELDPARRAALRAVFREEILGADRLCQILMGLPRDDASVTLLVASLTEDRQAALRRALDAIGLLYPGTSFSAAKPFLLEAAGSRLALALETAENVLSSEDRSVLIPAFAREAGADAVGRAMAAAPAEALLELLEGLPATEAAFLSVFTQYLAARWLLKEKAGERAELQDRQRRLGQALAAPHGLLPGMGRDELEPFLEELALFHRLEFFAGVTISSLAQVARQAGHRTFEAGQSIIELGEAGHSLFVLTRGRAQVCRRHTTIAEIGVGGVVGEMAALDPQPRAAAVTAVEKVTAVELDRATLLSLMRTHFDLAKAMLRMLAGRLRDVNA